MAKRSCFLAIIALMLVALYALMGCAAETMPENGGNGSGIIDEATDIMDAEEFGQDTQDIETGEAVMPILPEEVLEKMENDEDFLLLDVRTEAEYREGYIKGALLLPVQELEERIGELPRDIPVVVYCKGGTRSRNAADMLIENGFAAVYDMGAITSWTGKGYPLVAGE